MIRDPESSLLRDLYLHPPVYSVRLGETVISSFPTPHDSAASVGYTVEYEGEKFGLATDIGHITSEIATALTGADAVVLESNHDVDMLMAGGYPYPLKRRILSGSGHLCNEDCANALVELYRRGLKSAILGHLSAENNSPELALITARTVLDAAGIGEDMQVALALRDRPTGIFELV